MARGKENSRRTCHTAAIVDNKPPDGHVCQSLRHSIFRTVLDVQTSSKETTPWIVFPPGEPDQDARLRALTFAKANGCVIENRAGNREVLFLKPDLGPAVEI